MLGGPEVTLLSLLLGLSAAHADPLEIKVTDPRVIALVLDCSGDTSKALVKGGVARFPEVPKSRCRVEMVRTSGTVDEPGRWTCSLDECTLDDVHHKAVSNAPGRVNVVASGLDQGASLEINCPGGYRSRQPIAENTATFDGVPDEECTLFFKGGTPAKYQPLRWGTWYCSLTGTIAVCTMK